MDTHSHYSYPSCDKSIERMHIDRSKAIRIDKNAAYGHAEVIHSDRAQSECVFEGKPKSKLNSKHCLSTAILFCLALLALVIAAAALGIVLNQQAKMSSSATENTLTCSLSVASSCQQVLDCNPSSPSGYYWIVSADGNAVLSYCDMTRTCGGITGGWMRITALDMRVANTPCPNGLRERVHPGQRLCGINSLNCSQVLFSANVTYNSICGKIIAYQFGSTDAFALDSGTTPPDSIEELYLDGISLTYSSNPRKQIWSFVAALDEVSTNANNNCPCTNVRTASEATPPPNFVGNDYFCNTASSGRFMSNFLYADDPLWDGAGCGPANFCCSLNNPPWFFKQLQRSTSDDIEMRVCCNQGRPDEDILIEQIELYVH